ncbi:cytochrome C552, partial [Gluconobacter japonicus]
ILTFVASQEMSSGGPTFTAAEIAEERKHPLSPEEVLLERQKLEQQTPLP